MGASGLGYTARDLGENLSCLESWEEVVAPGWGERAVCWAAAKIKR